MANKGNSDAMQQETNCMSNPGPDTEEKSGGNSEPKEKQKETLGESQTQSHTHSDTQLAKKNESTVEDIKGGLFDESSPDTTQAENNTETLGESQTQSHTQSDTQQEDEEKDTTAEEIKGGPSGDSSLDNESKNKDENNTETLGESQTQSHTQSDTQQEDKEKDTTAEEIKGGSPNESSPDTTQAENNAETLGESQTQSHTQSDTQQEDEEKDATAEEIKGGPSGDSSLDNESKTKDESPFSIQNQEQEKVEEVDTKGINEDQNQYENLNLQPQITVSGNNQTFWISAAGVILLGVVCALVCNPDSTPPVSNELNVVDVFNKEMRKLETGFPNQHPELWRRSLIHLRRHLKTKNPTEPVSLILTSSHKAEKTLGCLAQCLAQAFSTALNSTFLHINGKDKASQDSDQVKLDIDSELKKAFEDKKSAAVIHRFEELPPGSTLIFYRYCDHENAAYKNVFLAFTVMLGADVEEPSNVNLGRVEEMVQDHIKHKFVSSDKSAMFNQMDIDKLGGLWSRISHLILPVAAVEKIELQGCEIYS